MLVAVTASECPAHIDIRNCFANGLAVGSLCEGDGECNTNEFGELENCGGWGDIYRVVGLPGHAGYSSGYSSEYTSSTTYSSAYSSGDYGSG